MTQDNKNLLLKDLCARLPYGVKCVSGVDDATLIIEGINPNCCGTSEVQVTYERSGINFDTTISAIKPYLFPLSSMSEDQKYEFYLRFIVNDCDFDCFKIYLDNGKWHKLLTSLDDIEAIIDWFHKNHIDYRCLIERGLAIDATDRNIY